MSEEELVIEHVHPTLHLDDAAIERAVRRVLDGEGFGLQYLGIILADHETVLELNRSYLDHDYVTDVLSFSLGDDEETSVVDGEIYIDLDTAAERHGEFGGSFEEEALRYIIHGLLHLMGYDDATAEQKQIMHALEDRYLPDNLNRLV